MVRSMSFIGKLSKTCGVCSGYEDLRDGCVCRRSRGGGRGEERKNRIDEGMSEEEREEKRGKRAG